MSFRVVFFSLAQHEITCTANQHWDEINMKCGLSVRSFFFFFWLLHLWAGHCLKCTRQNQFVHRRTCTCRAPGRLAETTGTRSKWYNRSQDDRAFGLHLVGQDSVGIHGATVTMVLVSWGPFSPQWILEWNTTGTAAFAVSLTMQGGICEEGEAANAINI